MDRYFPVEGHCIPVVLPMWLGFIAAVSRQFVPASPPANTATLAASMASLPPSSPTASSAEAATSAHHHLPPWTWRQWLQPRLRSHQRSPRRLHQSHRQHQHRSSRHHHRHRLWRHHYLRELHHHRWHPQQSRRPRQPPRGQPHQQEKLYLLRLPHQRTWQLQWCFNHPRRTPCLTGSWRPRSRHVRPHLQDTPRHARCRLRRLRPKEGQ